MSVLQTITFYDQEVIHKQPLPVEQPAQVFVPRIASTHTPEDDTLSPATRSAEKNDLLKYLISGDEMSSNSGVNSPNSDSGRDYRNSFAAILLQPQVVVLSENNIHCIVACSQTICIHLNIEKDQITHSQINHLMAVLANVNGYMGSHLSNSKLDQCWYDHSFLQHIMSSHSMTCTMIDRGSRIQPRSNSTSNSSNSNQKQSSSKSSSSSNLFEDEQAPKNLLIKIPHLNLMFTSSNLQTLIDMVTNAALKPTKPAHTVLMETISYKSKLEPEIWSDPNAIREICERLRIEMRDLMNQLVQSKKSQNNQSFILNTTNTLVGDKNMIEQIQRLESTLASKKILYHILKATLRSMIADSLKQSQKEPIDQGTSPLILVQINIRKTHFQMLNQTHQIPFMELKMTWCQITLVNLQNDTTLQTITIHHFLLNNLMPNSGFTHVILPHEQSEQSRGGAADDDGESSPRSSVRQQDHCMLRITANKNSKVNGIGGFEHLEIELSPIHIQLTFEIYIAIWNYAFPVAVKIPTLVPIIASDIIQEVNSMMMMNDDMNSSTVMLTEDDEVDQSTRSIARKRSLLKYNRRPSKGDIDVMKYRANRTVIFNYIRIAEVTLYVTYHGIPENVDTLELIKYVTNLEQCRVHLRTIIYSSKTWTWTELFENVRNDVIKHCLEYIVPGIVRSLTQGKIKSIGRIFNLSQSKSITDVSVSPPADLVYGNPIDVTSTQRSITSPASPVDSQDDFSVVVVDAVDQNNVITKNKILGNAKKYQQNFKNMLKKGKVDEDSGNKHKNLMRKMSLFGKKNPGESMKNLLGKVNKKNGQEYIGPHGITAAAQGFNGEQDPKLTEELYDSLTLSQVDSNVEGDNQI
ncbi:hypothetical protein AKO1_010872 [Acrasis kona]|uniref:FMP27 C-terminal domain-containing protein n=1 Tax=Acrasis kona TaxID=1008807 RepID=A0AAW2YKI6_9EUKA